LKVEDGFFEGFENEKEKAEHDAKMERVRNVLDNRGIEYDDSTVFRLAFEGEEAVRKFLQSKGYTADK
jgi:hypothetical protein